MILTTRAELASAVHAPGLQFRCGRCGEDKDVQSSGGTGYAYFFEEYGDKPVCYACCAEIDRESMARLKRYTLYLNDKERTLTNWPGTLRFNCSILWGRTYLTVYFVGPDGKRWTGRKRKSTDHQLINVKCQE